MAAGEWLPGAGHAGRTDTGDASVRNRYSLEAPDHRTVAEGEPIIFLYLGSAGAGAFALDNRSRA